MKVIGKRIKWDRYLFLLVFLAFVGIFTFQLYSIFNSSKVDTLLYVFVFIVLAYLIYFLTFTILAFLRKEDAILVQDDKLIVRKIKERTIDFKNITDIKYTLNYSGRIGTFKLGKIIITLINGKTIKVYDIKNAKNVCLELRKIILEK